MRKFGICLILLAVGSLVGNLAGYELPLFKWVDIMGTTLSEFLRSLLVLITGLDTPQSADGWFVHHLRLLLVGLGVWLLLRQPGPPNPLTQKKWKRFKAIRRGYISLWILGFLALLAGLDTLLVGKRALLVNHNGAWRSPVLEKAPIMGKYFGVTPGDSETDYRKLKQQFAAEGKGNWVLMPLIPYASRGDSNPVVLELELRNGKYYEPGSTDAYTGRAMRYFKGADEMIRSEFRLRDGLWHGETIHKDKQGLLVARVRYDKGQEKDRQVLDSTADAAALDAESETALRRIVPSPAPPNWQSRHYLGTDSSGNDLVAAAYGGFQLILGTSLYYIIIVYLVGIMLGCLMGYFGGWVDLGGQRLVEIWASIPLLFIVILIRSVIESPSVLMVVSLLAVFGWIGISAYMRTGTMREKARDYVAASQLQGASTTRMIVHHIVPNTLATIVTLIPFTITGLVFSLTSLDYLSFGLPPGAPSWGHLLKDGTDNLAASWIVLTGFGALVLFLLLVTFVGEAIREAFDPKKFTTYR